MCAYIGVCVYTYLYISYSNSKYQFHPTFFKTSHGMYCSKPVGIYSIATPITFAHFI